MQSDQEEKRPSKLIVAVLVAAFVAALAGLIWSYSLAGRLTHAEAQLAATQKQNQQLATALNETNAKLQVTSKTLGHRLSATQREMQRRAKALLHNPPASAAAQIQQNQQQTSSQPQQQQPGVNAPVTPAASSIAGPGAAETQTAQANPPVAGASAPMQKAQGDLGAPGGLIATNQSELKVLEQMGGRNYFPFTLHKGKKENVATIALLLRRVNVKHSTYTMTVYADGKKIEKKNRALDEPVQFYAGKQRQMFELVVNQISHNQVQGYISMPKAKPELP